MKYNRDFDIVAFQKSKFLSLINSNHSRLRGKINNARLQACGHSKGGGSDTLATNSMPRGEYGGLSSRTFRMHAEYTGYPHLA